MTFLRNTAVTVVTTMAITVINLLIGILLARTLGPTGRGLMVAVLLWPQVLSWAAGLSLNFSILYFGAAEPALRRRLLANSLYAALVLGGVVGVGTALVLPQMLPLIPIQRTLLRISLLALPVALFADSALALLMSSQRFDRVNLIRVSGVLVTGLGLVSLWLADALTVTGAILATWAGGCASICLIVWFLFRDGYASWALPDGALLRRTLNYGARTHLGTLASLANMRLDQLLMTALVAPQMLGLYAFATTLSEMLNQVANATALVLTPKVAGEVDIAARREIAIKSARWVLLMSVFGALLLYVAAPVAIRLLWGSRFLEVVPTVYVLLPGVVASSLSSALGAALRGVERPLPSTIAELSSLSVMIPLLLLLLPIYGIFGAGLASTLSYLLRCGVLTLCFARHFGRDSVLEIRPTRDDLREAYGLISSVLLRARTRRAAAR